MEDAGRRAAARNKGLKHKTATQELQKAAVAEDGAMESGVQPPKALPFLHASAFWRLRTSNGGHLGHI